MELIKDIIKIDSRLDFGKYQTFVESETVVPDTKLDVYEIIDTQGYIALSKVEVSDGKLICRGNFYYNVIYIADDKTTLSNVSGKIDINEVVEKDNIVQDMEHMLYSEVEHIDCTILNERKIRVGALMNIKGSLFDKQRIDIVKDVSQIESIQKHRKEIVYQDIVGIEKTESIIRDTIAISSQEVAGIINITPVIKVKESRIADNKVIIGGVLEISPLACTCDGDIVELDKASIDFTQFIEVVGAFDGMKEEILLSIGDFSYNFRDNSESNTCMLEIECTVCCKVKVTDEVTREVLQDAYSPQKIVKFDNRLISLNKEVGMTSEMFTVRETLNVNDEDIQVKDIVSVYPSISIENSYVDGSKSVIQGIIKVVLLFVPIEGEKMIYKLSEEIPFENDVIIDGLNDSCSIFNTVCIEKIEADINREEIDLIIKAKRYTEAIDKQSESFIIKGEDEGDYDLSSAPSLVVYVCKDGDNLWDIAKKYNTTEEDIIEVNEFKSDEQIKAGKCLILQKRLKL